MTNNTVRNNNNQCLNAEWDSRVNSVLIAYPALHTDWNYMLEEARECFDNIICTLSTRCNVQVVVIADFSTVRARFGAKRFFNNNIRVLDIDYNDTWARDFGPLQISDADTITSVDYKFNGWGLKFASCNDNEICRTMESARFITNMVNCQDFVLEGGSLETDGQGILLTTERCLLSPNRNGKYSQDEIEQRLKRDLGIKKILWLKHGALEGDDTDSHIDTLARFVNPDTIAYVKCDNPLDTHHHELDMMERELKELTDINGNKYNLIPLPMPDPIYDENGLRLPATYANFLILPNHVLVPTYGQDINDKNALEILKELFPSKEVIGLDCRALIKQHGSLHCVTMQMIL